MNEPIDKGNTLISQENRDNARLARAVARHLCVNEKMINLAITNFQPLPNRLNLLGEFYGVTFFDDGASSAPEATMSALSSLPTTTTLMLGGQDRGYKYDKLLKALATSAVMNLILFPDTDTKINELIQRNHPLRIAVFPTKSMD